MKTRTLSLIVLFMCLSAFANAQIGRFIKNQAEKAANIVAKESEKEAQRKADSISQANAEKAAKETSKNIEQNSQKSKTDGQTTQQQGDQGQGGIDLGKLMGGKVDLKYNDEYTFSSRLYMQSESYEKKGTTKMDLYMFFSGNSPDVGMETKSITDEKGNTTPIASSIVMDAVNKCFIILTDMSGTKMGIISPLPDENTVQTQPDGKPAQKVTPPVYTKTGNTKVIAGYKCDEYTFKSTQDNTSGKVWFTKDANLKIDKRGWQQTGMSAYYGYAGFDGGLIMGNETYGENGKLKMKSETKEINQNFPHTITVKGYSLMQMNQAQSQQKK
jgi:hypothetical protein